MKNLTWYANQIHQNKSNPHQLSELQIDIAARYAYFAEQMKDVKLRKAIFWNTKEYNEDMTIREKPLSDKAVEMKWKQTPEGKKEIECDYELKACEKLIKAITTATVVASNEAKNNF